MHKTFVNIYVGLPVSMYAVCNKRIELDPKFITLNNIKWDCPYKKVRQIGKINFKLGPLIALMWNFVDFLGFFTNEVLKSF